MSVMYNPGQVVGRVSSLADRVDKVVKEAWPKVPNGQEFKLGLMTDLDETLFDTGPRTAAVFEQFMRQSGLESAVQEEMIRRVWAKARRRDMPYLAKDLLGGTVEGVDADAWVSAWREGFFTNRFLRYDEVNRTVADLLHLLQAKHTPVSYITGRHRPAWWWPSLDPALFPEGMVDGTLSHLWRCNLPHGPVVFKNTFGDKDVNYKGGVFSGCLNAETSGLIPAAYVDNEPGLVNLHDEIMDRLGIPHLSIWFNSVHAPTPEPVQLRPQVLVLQFMQ